MDLFRKKSKVGPKNLIRWFYIALNLGEKWGFFAIQNLVDIQSNRFWWYSFVFERTQSCLVYFWSISCGQKANYKWRSYQADRPLVNLSATYDLDLWPKILKIFVSHGVPIRNMYAKFHNDRLRNGWDITLWNFAKTRTNKHTNKHTHKQTNTHTNRHGHYNTSPSPYGGRGNNNNIHIMI